MEQASLEDAGPKPRYAAESINTICVPVHIPLRERLLTCARRGILARTKNMKREIWLITLSMAWTVVMGGALLVMIVMY